MYPPIPCCRASGWRWTRSCSSLDEGRTTVASAQPAFRFTYEDYRTAPPDRRYELLDGDLVMSPAPNLKLQRAQVRLGSRWLDSCGRNALGEFFFAPCDVVLSDTDVVQPDLLFVSRERAHLLSGGRERAGRARSGGRDPLPDHCRAGPGLQARSLREARRGGMLAGRSRVRDGVGSPTAERRTGGRAHLSPAETRCAPRCCRGSRWTWTTSSAPERTVRRSAAPPG